MKSLEEGLIPLRKTEKKSIGSYAFDGFAYGMVPTALIGFGINLASFTNLCPETIYLPKIGEVHPKFILGLFGMPATCAAALGVGIIGAGINTTRGLTKKIYQRLTKSSNK